MRRPAAHKQAFYLISDVMASTRPRRMRQAEGAKAPLFFQFFTFASALAWVRLQALHTVWQTGVLYGNHPLKPFPADIADDFQDGSLPFAFSKCKHSPKRTGTRSTSFLSLKKTKTENGFRLSPFLIPPRQKSLTIQIVLC